MGQSNSYECKKCKKHLIASLVDTRGMNQKVLAIKCNDCSSVCDSIIEYSSSSNTIIKVEPSCCECSGINVIKWDGQCPNCNIKMTNNGLFSLWD